MALRVPGAQTNNRGEAYALLKALQVIHTDESISVYSDSLYVIQTITVSAPQHAAQGWRLPNGDIFRDIVRLIQIRTAPICLIQVKGHSGNNHHDQADRLANIGADCPEVPAYQSLLIPLPIPTNRPSLPNLLKVSAKLLPVPVTEKRLTLRADTLSSLNTHRDTHRKRNRIIKQQMEWREKLVGVDNLRLFWDFTKKLMSPKPMPPSFTAEELKETFEIRMNPLTPPPAFFDLQMRTLNHTLATTMPACTTDNTAGSFFSRPFTESDLEDAKSHLYKHSHKSAKGLDKVGYAELQEIDNNVLCNLLNKCLFDNDAPSVWLQTILIGIIKKGKPHSDPESYRTIGLESCMLKLMTLLIHKRLTVWCDEQGLLPPSQNGFREGHRTNDNAFVLRCAIDRARHDGKPLYAVFVDLSNAFPSTDHSTLWLKLRTMGAGGRIFDWLRMLYSRMTYAVRHNSELSSSFRSTIGILIGDTCSPILWNLYLADFILHPDKDDIQLAGEIITQLDQADDIILLACTPDGAQRKLDALQLWCRRNFMILNVIKSLIMIFGPLPVILPRFWFGDKELKVSTQETYVGITLRSTARNIFIEHYNKKASKAQLIGRMIFALESKVGTIPPWEARRLYTALLDPHLIHGCEVCLDIDEVLRKKLEAIQHSFLRRALGLNPQSSMLAPLFTETAILPLRFRRVILALKYLRYLVTLPPDRYAHSALQDSLSLAEAGIASWVTDLLYVLSNLPFRIDLPDVATISTKKIDALIKEVQSGAEKHLQNAIDSSPKLYLLRNRCPP
ncbi:hypothetical protein LshimejAT787_0804060 [Lyophyllum shimeji]|uniref:Reverse transcriptase domain-containing protein n=1 Tax=Lyophyllum shimeji TaxID=47721 RepID=A0A9P3PR89_LYOSH|nr:hypothetical protein LshimejAT787_0804060 [Lyophyllum shimeji]